MHTHACTHAHMHTHTYTHAHMHTLIWSEVPPLSGWWFTSPFLTLPQDIVLYYLSTSACITHTSWKHDRGNLSVYTCTCLPSFHFPVAWETCTPFKVFTGSTNVICFTELGPQSFVSLIIWVNVWRGEEWCSNTNRDFPPFNSLANIIAVSTCRSTTVTENTDTTGKTLLSRADKLKALSPPTKKKMTGLIPHISQQHKHTSKLVTKQHYLGG